MLQRIVLLVFAMLLAPSVMEAETPGSYGMPVPAEPNQIFFLQRSMNSNTIVYAANFDGDGKLSRKNPIEVFWRRFSDNGEKKELGFAERNLAFGVTAKPVPGEPGAFRITLKSYTARSAILRIVDHAPRLETKLLGKDVVLISAFLHLDESGRIPKVTKVDVWGRSLANGEPVFESFSP